MAPTLGRWRTSRSAASVVTGAGRAAAGSDCHGSSGAFASLGVANGVVAVREGLHPYRSAVTQGPDVGEPVVHLSAARLPAPSLAHRYHDVSAELLDVEQLDGEIVEGVVPLIQPLKHGLRAMVGLDGGSYHDVGGAQRLDCVAVARVDRVVDTRREVTSLGHRVKAIEVGNADTAAFAWREAEAQPVDCSAVSTPANPSASS